MTASVSKDFVLQVCASPYGMEIKLPQLQPSEALIINKLLRIYLCFLAFRDFVFTEVALFIPFRRTLTRARSLSDIVSGAE